MNSLSTLPTPEVCKQRAIEPGPAPMRLLSSEQYLNTMNDLVGSVPSLASIVAGGRDGSVLGLKQADVGQVQLEAFQRGADMVATMCWQTPPC